MVKIGFDPAKNAANMASRGLPFELVEQLDWAHALMEEDTRKAYGERRFQVLGFIGGGCTPLYLRRAKARCMSSVCARPIRERSRDMPKRPNPELIDSDNPEWTPCGRRPRTPLGCWRSLVCLSFRRSSVICRFIPLIPRLLRMPVILLHSSGTGACFDDRPCAQAAASDAASDS